MNAMTKKKISDEGKKYLSGLAWGTLRQRLIRGVSWNIVGTVLGQGSVFATSILVANRLGPQLFGEFSLLQNTALTLSAIAQVATGTTATRYVAQYRVSDPARAGRILGFCTLLTLITGLIGFTFVIAFSDWLSEETLRAPHLATGLKIMALYLLISAMAGFQTGALAGLEAYRRIATVGALHSIFHVGMTAIGVWFYGLPGALWALVGSLILRWGMFHHAIRQETRRAGIRIAYVLGKEEQRVLFRFSLPAALAGLTAMPALWLANTFLVQHSDGYRQLGLYSAAMSLKAAVMLLPIAVNSVGGAIINSHLGPNDQSRYREAYWLNVVATTSIALFGALVVISFSDFLLSFFGKEFLDAQSALVILLVSAVPEALAIALYQVIQTREKMWWSLIAVSIPRDGLIVVAAYYLAREIGAPGVSMAYLFGWIVALTVISVKVHRIGIKSVVSSNFT